MVATLLMLLLLVLSLQALWRLAKMAIAGEAATTGLLSDIIFVLILIELYRLMIYYLREHRISVALMVEVALVSILREVMLKGAFGFEWLRLVGLSLLLGVLGGLLAMERWTGAGGTRRPKSMPADHPASLPDRIERSGSAVGALEVTPRRGSPSRNRSCPVGTRVMT